MSLKPSVPRSLAVSSDLVAAPPRLSAAELNLLLVVTRALAAPFDLRALLAEVAAVACRLLQAERASVWLLDKQSGDLFVEISSDLRQARLKLGAGIVGAAALDRCLINVPDCYADPRFDAETDRRSGFHTRCCLALPLLDHADALVGVMQVLNKRNGVFGPGDEALASAFAAQCAVALSRARMTAALIDAERVRQEIELARVVQLATLPRTMPHVPGYEMHGLFEPAERTGGDTFDLALTAQGLLLVLGDATGHGIAPALSITQMHAMLRMALRLGASLESAFREVNDQLAAILPDGRFVAACFGLLDPSTHRVRLLSGGQAPLVQFHAGTGRFSVHRATSFPMGAAPIVQLRPALQIDMAPGDWLVLVTDGVYEQESPQGEPFGRGRLEALLCEHAAAGPAAFAERLLAEVQAFAAGAPQADDITMVLLRRLPAEAA